MRVFDLNLGGTTEKGCWSQGIGVMVDVRGIEVMVIVPDRAGLDHLHEVFNVATIDRAQALDVVFYPTRLPLQPGLSSRARLGGVGVGHGYRAELNREQDEMARIPCQGEEK